MPPFIQQNIKTEQSATKSEHTLNGNKYLENKRSKYFVFQLYLPSAIVVILSWLTLYIKMENDNQVLSSPVINVNRVLSFDPCFCVEFRDLKK